MTARPLKFAFVGVLGFVLQLAVLAVLTRAGCPWLPATIIAVEAAIVHNFAWHRCYTWAGRPWSVRRARAFVRFNGSAAFTSIAGNVLLMAFMVRVFEVPVVAANAIAVGLISLANFVIADRWVFTGILLLAAVPAQAGPPRESVAAWNEYVAAAEAQMAVAQSHPAVPAPEGRTIDVGDATISDWRGSVFVPHVTLDAFLDRLQNPGTPPPQEDVSASRVISRSRDTLHLYIQLVRRAIVTVTYDTEHDMTFRRLSPGAASARSVSTRIEEVGGGDKGFLWRINSYWYYEQTPDGVAVSLQSLTLSRDVPALIKPLAGRIIPRIARESMVRTLAALRAYFR